jgi:hypothetical protein
MTRTPLLSIIVIAYDMPRQAMNTLRSLSAAYQRDVDPDDYEVVVVENRSPRTLDPAAVAALPGSFRYFLREEPGVSPAPAINFGFAAARGRCIGLMIDGARMVTPGVVHHVLAANRVTTDALVVVPGYHLGHHEHQLHATHGYTEDAEQAMLRDIDWKRDGYALFTVACISGANRYGVFHPFMECNCLFMPDHVFRDIGRADERFDLPGGGALNLALYRRVAMHPRTKLFVLPGEGSFHQLHGGVTTSEIPDREALLARIREQLQELLGRPFRAPLLEPTFLGTIGLGAMRHLAFSVEQGLDRYRKCVEKGHDPHADETRKRAAQPLRLAS